MCNVPCTRHADNAAPPRTALFDMDGTLFALDSQVRFCRWVLRRHGWRRLYLLLVLPAGLLTALHLLPHDVMKRLFLSYAWGMRKEQLQAECRAFAAEELLPVLYPPVLERLRAHQAAGDVCVLCSASPAWWAQELAALLGFTHCIGTPVTMGDRVPLLPHLPAPGNNKGAAKLTRLAAQFGITRAAVGYTDSAADEPMLSICDRAVLVNPKPAFAARHPQAEVLHTDARANNPLTILLAVLGFGGR